MTFRRSDYILRGGDYVAVIAEVGATLRVLRRHGRDLVVPISTDDGYSAMRGALLLPWPNRVADGRYRFDGIQHQLEITEPTTGHALHGFAAATRFTPLAVKTDRVVLRAELAPHPGYPWRLMVEVTFALSSEGLTHEVAVTNGSETTAPIGIGGHPYLLAGPPERHAANAWSLTVPARRVLLISPEQMLPTALVDVADHHGGALDFRRRRQIRDIVLNEAFTDLERTHENTLVRLTDTRTGRGTEIEWDRRCRWVQLYTADHMTGDQYRHAVAVEPMTCPPDAFNSGQDLLRAAPGGVVSAGWTIRESAR